LRDETVSKNYAETLFELAEKHDAIGDYGAALDEIANLLDEDRRLRLFLETPRIDDDEKKQLGQEHSALAVDLESLAVAQVCKETGTKFLAVRTISDDTGEDLPPEILSIIGETGSVRLGAAVGSIWKRFGSVKEMWHLRERAVAASKQLAKFLSGLAPQLTPGSAKDES
jgi:hypothetical protein